METNDVTAEKVEKLYEYLNEKNTKKIKNIENNILERQTFITELEDDNRINEIKDEIEQLKKYREEYEEKLKNIEELKEFSNILKQIEDDINSKVEELNEVEKSINLNDEELSSNLHDLSKTKSEIEKSIENLNWQRKGKIGIILSSYEDELNNLPENMKYFSTITNLELSLENVIDVKNITLKRLEILKERLTQKGIEISENNVYDLSTLKGNDKLLAQRYNSMVNQLAEFDYDKKYYELQIETLKELADIEKQIEELSNENPEILQSLSYKRKELIEKVKQTQKEYNDKQNLKQEEQRTEDEKQEAVEIKNMNKKDKNIMNYHYSSDKLINNYQEKLKELNDNKYEFESRKNEILEEFNSNSINIEDISTYQDNEELVQLKEEYDRLSDTTQDIENDISSLENSDVLTKVEEMKELENNLEKLDNDLEEIKNDIEKYNSVLEDETIDEDSDEKKDAQKNIEKLTLEKNKKIDDKKHIIEQKDGLYRYINKKINVRKKENSRNTKSFFNKNSYDEVSNNSNVKEEIKESNDLKNNEVEEKQTLEKNEEKSLMITSGNVIQDYSEAADEVKNSIYLSKEFNNLVEDLKSARGLRGITRKQKNLLKNAIEKHGKSISADLHDMQPEVFTSIVKEIYGNDTEILNKYISKDINNGNDIINYGLYCDLYGESLGMVERLKALESMEPKSIEFINNLFDKYYQKIQNGEIEENSSLDIQFKKMIANPVKFGIISSYNKDIQKPFIFRLNKIKTLFSKKAKLNSEKVDNISSNIKLNEEKMSKNNNEVTNKLDRLGLSDALEKNPPLVVKAQTKETPSKDIDVR